MKTHLYSIFFMVIVATMLYPINKSHACSCIEPPPPLDALAQADAVFSGKVTVIDQNSDDFSIRFQFAVIDVWKGVTTAETQVITATNSAACGVEFQADEQYLVYAYQDDNGELNTNLCTRTRLLEYAEDDIAALGQPILSFNMPPDARENPQHRKISPPYYWITLMIRTPMEMTCSIILNHNLQYLVDSGAV